MKLDLDRQTIDIPCPNCGQKRAETVGRLKTNPQLTCRCGTVIRVDATELRSEIAKLEKSFADLNRTLGRLGK
jgi:uncharacterized Zn finger protein